jgi:hypothetical protein
MRTWVQVSAGLRGHHALHQDVGQPQQLQGSQHTGPATASMLQLRGRVGGGRAPCKPVVLMRICQVASVALHGSMCMHETMPLHMLSCSSDVCAVAPGSCMVV